MDLFDTRDDKKGQRNIKCNVSNCVHHCDSNHCGADKIDVGPSYASQTADTVCATFSQK